MNDAADNRTRRCTDCAEHSGIVAELESGRWCMQRLEKSIDKLRNDFSDHVESSSKSTIAVLIGILMCFLTGVIGIYGNSQKSEAEMTILVKEVVEAIQEAKE
jgi:hypothetical protein